MRKLNDGIKCMEYEGKELSKSWNEQRFRLNKLDRPPQEISIYLNLQERSAIDDWVSKHTVHEYSSSGFNVFSAQSKFFVALVLSVNVAVMLMFLDDFLSQSALRIVIEAHG